MSVFQSIKGTFAAGLKSITSRDGVKEEKLVRTGVSLDAGADLLDRYQNTWRKLHQDAEQNATQAQNVDSQITQLFVTYDRQSEILGQLHLAVADLPVILHKLQELTDVLASLDEEYDNVEVALVRLEDICEEQELAQAKVYDGQKLASYTHRKSEELQKIKVEFAKDHAKKMEGYEKHRQTKLKERQEVFEQQFNNDLDYFKSHGRLERLSTSSNDSSKKTDLADISWEMENTSLDEFLETDTVSGESHPQTPGNDDAEFEDEVEEISEEEEEEEDSEEEERIDVTLPRKENKLSESVDKTGGGETTLSGDNVERDTDATSEQTTKSSSEVNGSDETRSPAKSADTDTNGV
ncbi:dysbindin protein homolog [Mizuhopecten yessoensis]|uniref:Dysbindin n=1 Tax=Mizuhopecten yessoensis TaxID=6573 RepID=A0A210R2H0_MIZYE|nr:dysbindin protein homolog [Mizuhopecten yessoensis]OWF55238.1 Dysbindin [Mizuhopecten yessoensis]